MLSASEIRALRAHLNENQEAFARRLGVPKYTVIVFEQYGMNGETPLELRIKEIIRQNTE